MEKKIKVAFQGEKGAYSHLTCLEVFPDVEAKACSTFEEAFQLAKDDSKYKIVIPIENSLAGRVADIHYLIPKYKLQIHAEHFQKVNHNLLGIRGSKIKNIKTVRSHAQALGQAQKFISDKEKLHPTQKPVALLEYLIKTYTNENDTVLDFTMGSGSTGVAAKNLNREFIGIELDKNYFDMASKRIDNEME